MKNVAELNLQIQQPVSSLVEMFYLIETVIPQLPTGIDPYEFINAIDALVMRDKKYTESDALKAFGVLQYVKPKIPMTKSHREELLNLASLMFEAYENNLPEEEYTRVAELASLMSELFSHVTTE